MGKSSKKPNVEVAAASVSVSQTKASKKGKRGAGEAPEKRASSKKQKIEAEQVDQNKKKAKKLKKALIEPSGEKKDEARSSDFEEGFAAAPITVPPTKAAAKAKRGVEEATEKQASSKNQKIEVEKVGQSKKMVKKLKKDLIESPGKKKDETRSLDFEGEKSGAPKTKLVSAAKKKAELNDSSSRSDSDEEDRKPVKSKPKAAIAVSKKKVHSSDSSSESELDEEVKNVSIAMSSKITNESSDSSSESDSDAEDVRKAFTAPKAAANAPKKKPESSDSFSGSDSDVANKFDFNTLTVQKTDNKSKDSLLDDAKNKGIFKISEKELETAAKRDEEFGTKRLFIGNLPSEVTKDDLLEFFKKAGEVTEVRLAFKEEGSFRGFGHVEFVTEADARKALRMNGHMLLGRPLIVDLARERGSNDPHEGKENGSYRKGVQDSGHSVFVKGFGKSLEEVQIRNSLEEHFESCGEIIRVSIPQDNKTGRSKGFAYVLFNDQATVSKALELNGTELGGSTLTVQEPTPKSGPRDGAYGGGRGREGRSVGQGGGRDGGGRGRGRGGRGPGAPFNRSAITGGKGKKTTFGDND